MRPIDTLRFVLPTGRLAPYEFALVLGGLIVGWVALRFYLIAPVPAYLWFCAAVNRLRDMGRSPAWLLVPWAGPAAVIGFLWLALVTLDDPSGESDGSMRAVAFGGMIMIVISVFLSFGLFNLCLALIPGKAAAQAAAASQKSTLRG